MTSARFGGERLAELPPASKLRSSSSSQRLPDDPALLESVFLTGVGLPEPSSNAAGGMGIMAVPANADRIHLGPFRCFPTFKLCCRHRPLARGIASLCQQSQNHPHTFTHTPRDRTPENGEAIAPRPGHTHKPRHPRRTRLQSRPRHYKERTGIYWGSVLLAPSQAAGSSLSLVLCSEPLVRIDTIRTDQVRRQRELDKSGRISLSGGGVKKNRASLPA